MTSIPDPQTPPKGKNDRTHDIRLLARLFPYIRPYRRWLAISVLLVVVITLLDLTLPYITKIVIDDYILPPETAAKTSEAGPQERSLQVDLSNPGVAAIVRKYPALFRVQGTSAIIPYTDLSRLARPDLKTLRQKDMAGITMMTVVLVVIVVAYFILNFFQVQTMEYAGQHIMHDLRMALFGHIQGQSLAFFNKHPTGRLVTRATNDVQNMQELFTSVLTFLFKDLFVLAGVSMVLFGIHAKLAAVTLLVLPVVLLVARRFGQLAREAFRTLRTKLAEINTRFSESVQGIRVLQLFGQEMNNYRDFKRLNREYFMAGMTQVRLFAVFMPIIEVMGSTAVAVVIYYGGRGVLDQTLSLGDLAAFISYLRMLFRPIRDLAEKFNILQNALSSAEKIFAVLDTREQLPQPAETEGDRPVEHVSHVAFDRVDFAYVAGEPVLKSVSFDLRAGDTVAIVGLTGSGKTTLMHLLMRFYEPTGGAIRVNGRPLTEIRTAGLRARMAWIPQDPFLFSGTVKDNILEGNTRVSGSALQEILAQTGVDRIVEDLPQGLDTLLGEGGVTLSSGQRQLISILRAFVRDPDLIIFDEATSYVDSVTEQQVQKALSHLMAGRTTVIIAHRLSTARHADRIMVLHHGRLVESGTHETLMAKGELYSRLYHLQHLMEQTET